MHNNVRLELSLRTRFCSIKFKILLTPSLPRCHLKMISKSAKSAPLSLFAFFFAPAFEWIFIKSGCVKGTEIILFAWIFIKSGCVKGTEIILFAAASVYRSARKSLQAGQCRG